MSSPYSPPSASDSGACALQQNVGAQERVACTMGGAGLILGGLFQSGVKQALMLMAGGALLYRGVSGHCHLYDRLGIDTRETEQEFAESSDGSFLGGS